MLGKGSRKRSYLDCQKKEVSGKQGHHLEIKSSGVLPLSGVGVVSTLLACREAG